MKKKKLDLGKLNLKKSKVATLESESVTGGFQSWTGTAEPCVTDFVCGTVYGCGGTGFTCDLKCQETQVNCPPQTINGYTCNCPSIFQSACGNYHCP